MLRETTYPPAAVNVLDVSSESMAAFQVFLYGRFWVITEAGRQTEIHATRDHKLEQARRQRQLRRQQTASLPLVHGSATATMAAPGETEAAMQGCNHAEG
jgi:hypothetical protein